MVLFHSFLLVLFVFSFCRNILYKYYLVYLH
nr:MAG TPA: Protein of unknown function (DUF1244) [Caudoviricetes sp.]